MTQIHADGAALTAAQFKPLLPMDSIEERRPHPLLPQDDRPNHFAELHMPSAPLNWRHIGVGASIGAVVPLALLAALLRQRGPTTRLKPQPPRHIAPFDPFAAEAWPAAPVPFLEALPPGILRIETRDEIVEYPEEPASPPDAPPAVPAADKRKRGRKPHYGPPASLAARRPRAGPAEVRTLPDGAVAQRVFAKRKILHLRYRNTAGDISERDVTTQHIEVVVRPGAALETISVGGLCHLRNAYRLFTVSRILSAHDTKTGEVITDFAAHLRKG